jgi:transcription elongation factor GreA
MMTGCTHNHRVLPLTAAAYRKLEAEFEQLRHERAEYEGEDLLLDARLTRVREILNMAEVVDDAVIGRGIGIGSEVSVLDHASGRTETYIVDGAHGSLDSNVISAVSPMGLALIGRERGDVIRVDLPRGRVRRLSVLDVTAGPSG